MKKSVIFHNCINTLCSVSKTIKNALLLVVMLLFIPKSIYAQQMYHVHEDVVKPSMTMEYESVLQEVGELIKENPLEDVNMLVLQGYNNHYYFVSPISSMADLDKQSPVAQLAEKAGQEKVGQLFKRMDKCYDVEKDYVIILDNDLSYMPNGMTQTPEGENYREQYKIYVAPENRAVVREKMKAIKALSEKNNSKSEYRVYRSDFGTEAAFYLFSISAKDATHMAEKSKANEELMGEDGKAAMSDLFLNILKIEEIEGQIRPDLGTNSN